MLTTLFLTISKCKHNFITAWLKITFFQTLCLLIVNPGYELLLKTKPQNQGTRCENYLITMNILTKE